MLQYIWGAHSRVIILYEMTTVVDDNGAIHLLEDDNGYIILRKFDGYVTNVWEFTAWLSSCGSSQQIYLVGVHSGEFIL